jgi:hypothetical protein
MRFPSRFVVRRRASSRPRPARRPASCRLAIEALEDRNAPGSLAADVFPNEPGTLGLGGLSKDALSDLTWPKHPTATIGANLDNTDVAWRPAKLPSLWAPQAPDSRVPASDSNSDARSEIVTPDNGMSLRGGVAGLPLAPPIPSSAPTPISGKISADADGEPTFDPIRQEGCVITFAHPGEQHDLTGSVQGSWIEDGILTLDVCTGQGFFRAEGVFTGTVLGRGPGTAILRVHGEVRNFFFIDHGHFVITQGQGGLAGVHAVGSFEYTVPHGDPESLHGENEGGGSYVGLAHFDHRR